MTRAFSRGFTLIEMLIALSIFASLMAILMSGYSQGLSLWDRAQRHSSQWQALEYRYGLLADLFIQAQVADYRKVVGMYVPYYEGSATSVRFLTRAPILDFPGRIRPVELALERRDDDSYDLVYKEAARHSDPGRGINWRGIRENLLISGIKSASFQHEASSFPLPLELDPLYLDNREKLRYRGVAEWLPAFDSAWMWRVPQRVRLSFIGADGVEHRWTFPLPARSDAWSLEVYSEG